MTIEERGVLHYILHKLEDLQRAIDILHSTFLRELAEQSARTQKGVDQLMSKVTDFVAQVEAQFNSLSESLNNIAADEANLAQQISDLKDQIANGLSTEDQAALDKVLADATSLTNRVKGVADSIPDSVVPPPVEEPPTA